MEIVAVQKFLLTSPRKLRVVVSFIKKMKPREAIEKLPFVGKRAEEPLRKVIQTALANAKDRGVSEGELVFKEIQINEGPRLKRGRPVSRGQWHPIKKRMSHIRIVLLTEVKEKEPVSKEKPSKEEVKKENGTKS